MEKCRFILNLDFGEAYYIAKNRDSTISDSSSTPNSSEFEFGNLSPNSFVFIFLPCLPSPFFLSPSYFSAFAPDVATGWYKATILLLLFCFSGFSFNMFHLQCVVSELWLRLFSCFLRSRTFSICNEEETSFTILQ